MSTLASFDLATLIRILEESEMRYQDPKLERHGKSWRIRPFIIRIDPATGKAARGNAKRGGRGDAAHFPDTKGSGSTQQYPAAQGASRLGSTTQGKGNPRYEGGTVSLSPSRLGLAWHGSAAPVNPPLGKAYSGMAIQRKFQKEIQ